MDISVIEARNTNSRTGLKIGNDTAPVKVVEFVNLRCPYCKQWFDESKGTIEALVKEGKVQRIIKLFDKEKESLQRGNVMHRYVPKKSPQAAYLAIQKILASQKEWGSLSLTEVAHYAEETLGLLLDEDSTTTQAVIKEASAANIKFVPTVIVNEHIFDESITTEELKKILNQK